MAGNRYETMAGNGNETCVWLVDLDEAAPALMALEEETARLSQSERTRAAAIKDAADARMWRAAHVALRLALERVSGSWIRQRDFSQAPGKPHLPSAPKGAMPTPAFSLSHAAGHALIATAPREPLGIDLETMRPVRMAAKRRAAIEAAARMLCREPLPRDDAGQFLQAWVRLEARAKADGSGLATVLSQAGAYGRRRGEAPSADLLQADMRVADLALGPGLYGAIATASDVTGIHIGRMPADLDALRAYVLGR